LSKNPNFHGEAYPSVGEASDEAKGLLIDAGIALPMIKTVASRLSLSV